MIIDVQQELLVMYSTLEKIPEKLNYFMSLNMFL